VLGCGLQTNTHTYTHTNNQTGKKHKLNSRSALRLLLLTTTTTTTIIVEQKRVCMVFFFFEECAFCSVLFSFDLGVSSNVSLFSLQLSFWGILFVCFFGRSPHNCSAVDVSSVLPRYYVWQPATSSK
jgi:hypothetical protein